jgi:D-alanyl-D-alanine carboxypeptidase
VFGFVAAAFALSGHPTGAAPYADIVVDANSGNVLHATNPDALRHPASLTKIMTLFLLFEQIEDGKLKLDSHLKVSEQAAEQSPTKLGLRVGSSIQVEDAIKGIITRSANDASVVVAEAIAGSEAAFAKLMTRKARALGMSRTVYKNASGLPDDEQVTSARDQSILGRAIQERFPRQYKYFSMRSFSFRGQSIGNHNRLLGRVEGVDGIKTGYIRASGFNLVTSVRRGNRHLVAVVMGGSSAGSRDARMRDLISEKIAQASTKRSVPMVAEAVEPRDAKTASKIAARAEPQKPERKPEPKAEPRFALASAHAAPVRYTPTSEPAAARTEPTSSAATQPRIAPGSTDPIQPVLVKTLTVRTGTQTASLAPTLTPSAVVAELKPVPTIAPPQRAIAATTPIPAVKTDAGMRPEVIGSTPARVAEPPIAPVATPVAHVATPVAPVAHVPVAPVTAPVAPVAQVATPVAPVVAPVAQVAPPAPQVAKPRVRSGWMIQVGAYPAEQEAKQRLTTVQSKASKMLTRADPYTETVEKGGTTLYRARFAGLDKDAAEAACKYLKRNDVDCVTIKN